MTSNEQYGSEFPTTGIPVNEPYPEGGFVPPAASLPEYQQFSPPNGAASQDPAAAAPGESSTAEVAKDRAASVAGGAADAAQHVAGVAKDQVGAIAAEGGRQARQLLGQAQSELSEQAQVQQQRVAGGLRALGDQLASMARGSQEQGVATDLAHQAADKAHDVAAWLEGRDPGSVLDEVRSFARQRPGTFLAIAVGAGLLTGRLVRGLTADPDTTSASFQPTKQQSSTPYPALDSTAPRPVLGGGPAPAVSSGAPVADQNQYPAELADWTNAPVDTSGSPR